MPDANPPQQPELQNSNTRPTFFYRIGGGKLTIIVELKRPHKIIKTAIDALMVDIEAETGIKPLIGTVTLPSA